MITLKQAIEQILAVNPFLGKLLQCEEPLGDYCRRRITSHEFNPVHLERQKPYIELIKNKISSLFPDESIVIKEKGMIVDTTEHHNILNFPAIIGAHLMARFDTLQERQKRGDYYVLDTGNVTFSEGLHGGGIMLGGKKIKLYPKKAKNRLISRYPKHKYDIMDRVRKSHKHFNEKEIEFLEKLQAIMDEMDFSNCARLSDQIIKINYRLWSELFGHEIRDRVRRCITLEHDEIIMAFLKDFLLKESDNIIWQALFDRSFRKIVLKEFDGLYGAWNYSGPDTGTSFFWGADPVTGRRYRLVLKGDSLVSPAGGIRTIRLEPQDVVAALDEGILIASIFTRFALLAFYLGAKTMGGPGQTRYMGHLKDAWLRTLEQTNSEEFKLLKQVEVMNFIGADLAFSRNERGELFRQWGMDMAAAHRFSSEYLTRISRIPLKYFIYPLLPETYKALIPEKERQAVDFSPKELYKGFNWIK